MTRARDQKNEVRRKYRAALRSNQPKETIVHLASSYHRLVREHNRIRRQKESLDMQSRMQKDRNHCAANMWKLAGELLDDDTHTGTPPSFSEAEATSFFRDTYSSQCQQSFQTPSWMAPRELPINPFDTGNVSISEITSQLKKSRNGSAPCPYDQISYKLLKKCPSIVEALLNIFNHCLYRSSVPSSWKAAVVILLGKPAAKKDSHNPSNFRPIALTPCIGRLFTAILKNRLLLYVAENGYLNTTVQKAFINSVPGCLEHQVKLSCALQEARLQQKTITVCWLDLANTFGSVEHDLILLTLEHYHLKPSFIRLVQEFYRGLSVVVTTRNWTTDTIPLNVGIFQGDPMSVIIFNLVANLFVELITENYHHLGYQFTGSAYALSLLQYADDSYLMSNSLENCQLLCNVAQMWLEWAHMRAKVPKCHVLAIRRGKIISDPQLTLNNLPIPPVADEPITFLGMPLSSTFDDNHHKQHLVCKLELLMAKVDRSFLSRKQKLKVISLGVCPRLAWDLMVIQLPITWVERQLDPFATSYLKRWSGLARCANTSLLYLSQSHGGLHLPSLSTTFKKLHVSRMAQLLFSRDGCVRFVATRLLQQEGDTSGRAFLPASVVNSIMITHGCISKKKLKGLSTSSVSESDESNRLQHLQSLQVQGECFSRYI